MVLRRLPAAAKTEFDAFAMFGGLDLHTPQSRLKPGVARDAINYQCGVNGGYARLDGYERYDGRPKPSDASYTVLEIAITGSFVVGDSVNGQTSGATGVVAAINGSQVVVTKAVGTFQAAENFRLAPTTVVGTVTTVGAIVSSQVTQAEYRLAAANIYRSDIGVVPGSGPVRGVLFFGGQLYAFRNNSGGTAAVMHRATSGGWVAVTMPFVVSYTVGSGSGGNPPSEGQTLTQGGVTAVIRRVLTRTGTWGGTAVGTIVIDTIAGGNFAAGAATVPGGTLTLGGAQTQVSFLAGGRFEFDIGNAGKGVRAYGCDGVNSGFEFDGTYVVPIPTGMTSDAPTHVRVHRRHLFFSFGPSSQNSSIGDPYAWTVVTGANELLVNQNVTGYLVLPGNQDTAAMAIIYADGMAILYGSGTSSWQLVEFNYGVGGKAYTAAAIGQGYMLDDLGVVAIPAVQEFGNFAATSLTQNIRAFTQARKTLATASLVNREKSQYRVYYSDGYGLYLTVVNKKFIGSCPVQFPNPVFVACNGESTNGGEVSYFGSTNGYVYQMDVGTSFDGAAIDASFALAFNAQGNSQVLKDYRGLELEIQGDGYAQFQIGQLLDYGDVEVDQKTASSDAIPVYWDEFTWDEFIWDGRVIAPAFVELDGVAQNISLAISQSSALWPSYTINSATLRYLARRLVRH